MTPDDEIDRYIQNLHTYGFRESAGEALIKKGDAAVRPLLQCLGDRDKSVRQYAAYLLGEIGSEAALDALKSAEMDPENSVRKEAHAASDKIRRNLNVQEQQRKREQEVRHPQQERQAAASLNSEGIKFCSLCNRYVHPKREFRNPIALGATSFLGLIIASIYSSTLTVGGQYSGFASATLGALLEFSVTMFIILLVGSGIYAALIGVQKKRCPICNARV